MRAVRRWMVFVVLLLSACDALTGEGEPFQVEPPHIREQPVSLEVSPSPANLTRLPGAKEPANYPWLRFCANPAPALITNLQVYQPPEMAEPTARVPFRDTIFGSCILRLSDRLVDISPDDDSPGLKNEYSRVQAFNADNSRLLLRGIYGTWYLYDANTFQTLGQLPLDLEPRWDAADPNRLYYLSGTSLFVYDLVPRQAALIRDFAADFPGQALAMVWTRYEGSPSADSRYWGLLAQDPDWQPVAFLVYDRISDQTVVRDIRNLPGAEDGIDHVSISPMGNYYLAAFDRYCERGQLGSDTQPCGLMVYDRQLKQGRSLLRIVGHYDLALSAEGREVIVFQDIDQDNIAMLDLASGEIAPLYPIDFSYTSIGLHFSGQAFDRPGWALVSTHDGDQASHTWMDDQVFVLELKADGKVVRLAHTHSLVDENQEHDYWAEPHATVNRDFTRVLFTSNWGRSGSEAVDTYYLFPDF